MINLLLFEYRLVLLSNEIRDARDHPLPIVVVVFLAVHFGIRVNYLGCDVFELADEWQISGNKVINLQTFPIELASIVVAICNFLTQLLLILLVDHSDKKIEQDYLDQKLVDEPKDPDDCDHEIGCKWFCVDEVAPDFVGWSADITHSISVGLNKIDGDPVDSLVLLHLFTTASVMSPDDLENHA